MECEEKSSDEWERGLNIHRGLRQILVEWLGGKGIVGVRHLRYLTGCLRAADNRLCGKTIPWKEGEVERRR